MVSIAAPLPGNEFAAVAFLHLHPGKNLAVELRQETVVLIQTSRP